MENINNTTNTTHNKPLSLLTNELETSLVNTINKYTSILHPSIIEMVVGKVYTNVCQFAEQHANREQTEYEKALAETQESTEQ
jgi:hypothetical protein